MNIEIKPAIADDAKALADIQQQAFKRLYDIYHDEGNPYLRGADEIQRWLERPNCKVFKILANGILVGGVAAWERNGLPGEYYLARIYILPEMQKKGIASQAILLCEAEFPNASRWTLDFPADQPANRRCYEKAGYMDTGEMREQSEGKIKLALYEKRIPKPHGEESDKERQARIYPVILSEYNPAWPEWYAEEKTNLERLVGIENIARISHFGSTSVPGLTAKPTIDILLEISEAADIDKLITSLSPYYIYLKEESAPTILTQPLHLMFLKGYLSDGFAEKVYHIHVVRPGDWDERLLFRDYLIVHHEAAAEYAKLKQKLFKNFEHDRDGYSSAKGAFIKEITDKANPSCSITSNLSPTLRFIFFTISFGIVTWDFCLKSIIIP